MANLSVEVSDDNDVISGATVTLDEDSSETTGDDGKVLFEDVILGSHTVSVEKEGYVTNTVDVNLTADATITVVLEQEQPTEREVNFTFVNPQDNPVANADITIFTDDGEIKRTTGSAGGCTATLTDGEYLIEGGNGEYIVPQGTFITVDETHTSFTIKMMQDI